VIKAVPAAANRDRLLSIGAFARRSRLSIKALRLYDRSALLMPADVNPATGYRRYRESQLLRARLIVMMRRAGIPLAQVAEIIAAPGQEGAELLAAYWADAERGFGVQRDLISRLRLSLLAGAAVAADGALDIRERDVPGQLVLTEKRSLRITELKGWLPAALSRLAETARQHGGLAGEQLAIYHGEVNEDSDGPVEVCAPVASSTELPLGVTARYEAAHREAYVTITRAQLEYPQILSAYDAVADWISSAGLTQAGPPREVYLCGIDDASAAPGDPVCHVAYPIAGSDGDLGVRVGTGVAARNPDGEPGEIGLPGDAVRFG
jgi:DNA-binding transcriptional MerR regulator